MSQLRLPVACAPLTLLFRRPFLFVHGRGDSFVGRLSMLQLLPSVCSLSSIKLLSCHRHRIDTDTSLRLMLTHSITQIIIFFTLYCSVATIFSPIQQCVASNLRQGARKAVLSPFPSFSSPRFLPSPFPTPFAFPSPPSPRTG